MAHNTYAETARQASRFVLCVYEVALRDRLASSHLNMFLLRWENSKKCPRQDHKSIVSASQPAQCSCICCM